MRKLSEFSFTTERPLNRRISSNFYYSLLRGRRCVGVLRDTVYIASRSEIEKRRTQRLAAFYLIGACK